MLWWKWPIRKHGEVGSVSQTCPTVRVSSATKLLTNYLTEQSGWHLWAPSNQGFPQVGRSKPQITPVKREHTSAKGTIGQGSGWGQPHTCTFPIWNHLHMSSIRKGIKMRDADSEKAVHVWAQGICGESLYLSFKVAVNLKLLEQKKSI